MKKIVILASVVLLVLSTVAYSSKGMTKENNFFKKEVVKAASPSKDVSEDISKKNNSFESYIKLIGLNKKELINALGEEPTSVDEGGLEFSKLGIRVWFENYGTGPVQQVFISNKDVDFNGVKVGDNISSFKNVFGKPIKEDISSSYSNFEYNGVVLSVYYDAKTETTFAVYILDKSVK